MIILLNKPQEVLVRMALFSRKHPREMRIMTPQALMAIPVRTKFPRRVVKRMVKKVKHCRP
jgi:hypothetical protein